MDFWASLAPCEKASHAEVTHCARRSVLLMPGRARTEQSRHELRRRKPTPKPTIGLDQQAQEHLGDAMELAVSQFGEPQTTWSDPTATTTAPHRPPVKRVRRRGRYADPPRPQVPRDRGEDTAQDDGDGADGIDIAELNTCRSCWRPRCRQQGRGNSKRATTMTA